MGDKKGMGGGGRYDGLVEECGGPSTPGIGFGIGTERCLIVLDQLGVKLPLEDERPTVVIAPLGDAPRPYAVKLLGDLRAAGISADMDYAGRSLKSQMRQADRLEAHFAVILGEAAITSRPPTLK